MANGLAKWGTPGDGDGELNRPSGLAFDQDDRLYVVDSQNHRVQTFGKDGTFLAKWGTHGSGEGEFDMPWGIAIDAEGAVYVSDWRNDRIQKFTADGQFLMSFGTPGTGEGEFDRPTGIAVDQDGIIYVADWRNERLQVFNPDGSFILQLAGEGHGVQVGKGEAGRQCRDVAAAVQSPGVRTRKSCSGGRSRSRSMLRTGFLLPRRRAAVSRCMANKCPFSLGTGSSPCH